MAMHERTYRYSTAEPLWYFGDGISYTHFHFSNLNVTTPKVAPCDSVRLQVQVNNVGKKDGDCVVLAFISNKSAKVPVPQIALAAFDRKPLRVGGSTVINLEIGAEWMSVVTDAGNQVVESSHFELSVCTNHPQSKMPHSQCLHSSFDILGVVKKIDECDK